MQDRVAAAPETGALAHPAERSPALLALWMVTATHLPPVRPAIFSLPARARHDKRADGQGVLGYPNCRVDSPDNLTSPRSHS